MTFSALRPNLSTHPKNCAVQCASLLVRLSLSVTVQLPAAYNLICRLTLVW